MKSKKRGMAQLEATVLLVAVSISLTFLAYSGIKGYTVPKQPAFLNNETILGGNPRLARIDMNVSSSVSVTSVSIDSISSKDGILYFGQDNAYHTTSTLCTASGTTFFSVFASNAGTLQVSTNGKSWIAGSWASSKNIQAGWHEVMIVNGSAGCQVVLPGNIVITSPQITSLVSSVPLEGASMGQAFSFCVPIDSRFHQLLVTTDAGLDVFDI